MTYAITRAEMAKMISVFVEEMTIMEPESRPECSAFSDLKKVNAELQGYIVKSCELGLMGMKSNGTDVQTSFRPKDTISRAEVGTIISRILRGTKYAPKPTEKRYQGHLQALKDAQIMDDISKPNVPELRGNVMTMLMRIDL